MKKAISVILMLIAAILSTACSGSKMSAPEGSTSAVTKDPDELFAEKMRQQQYDYWVTYVNPKSNEEMKAYGYNDNGELTLPLSELRHCEEIFPQKVLSQSRKPDPVADRFKPGSVEYGHSEYGIEIIGYVTDLVSHCVREENILNSGHDEELPGIPKQWYVIYNGYTETKITITGVISVGNHAQDENYDYSYLIGKEVTVRQNGFWYYDDSGELRKDGANRRYTYVLKPNTEAVIAIDKIDKNNMFSACTTGAEAYAILTNQENPCYVYDFYPATNKQGEKITNSAMLEEYFKSLDEEYGGLYDPWGKKNAVKENLAL